MLVALYVIKLMFQQRKNFVIFALMECADKAVVLAMHGWPDGVLAKVELENR